MTPSHLEVEDKYDVAPDAVLPPLDGLPQVDSVEKSEHRLEATYFDTTNLRLAAAGITVRRRTGGPDAGWHLKLPADRGRHEVTMALSRGKVTVPKRLRDTVRVFVADEALEPIARLCTHRTDHRLLDQSGRLLAVVSDDVVEAEWQTGRPDGGSGRSSWPTAMTRCSRQPPSCCTTPGPDAPTPVEARAGGRRPARGSAHRVRQGTGEPGCRARRRPGPPARPGRRASATGPTRTAGPPRWCPQDAGCHAPPAQRPGHVSSAAGPRRDRAGPRRTEVAGRRTR